MKRRLFTVIALPAFVACSGEGMVEDDGLQPQGAEAAQQASQTQPERREFAPGDAPEARDAAMEEIAAFASGDGDIVFAAAANGSVMIYGRTPTGGKPVDADLLELGPAELFRLLAPDQEVPEVLVRAEQLQNVEDPARDQPVEAETSPSEVLSNQEGLHNEIAPTGQGFGALEVWYEDNYCGFSGAQASVCKLGRTSFDGTIFTNSNTSHMYFSAEVGSVTWRFYVSGNLTSQATYGQGYTYGPLRYFAGADYGLWTYWRTRTIRWEFVPSSGGLYHYSAWSHNNGRDFIGAPGTN